LAAAFFHTGAFVVGACFAAGATAFFVNPANRVGLHVAPVQLLSEGVQEIFEGRIDRAAPLRPPGSAFLFSQSRSVSNLSLARAEPINVDIKDSSHTRKSVQGRNRNSHYFFENGQCTGSLCQVRNNSRAPSRCPVDYSSTCGPAGGSGRYTNRASIIAQPHLIFRHDRTFCIVKINL